MRNIISGSERISDGLYQVERVKMHIKTTLHTLPIKKANGDPKKKHFKTNKIRMLNNINFETSLKKFLRLNSFQFRMS